MSVEGDGWQAGRESVSSILEDIDYYQGLTTPRDEREQREKDASVLPAAGNFCYCVAVFGVVHLGFDSM